MEFLSTPEFWIAVGQIILIDILLGGDNAVVIALACRKLPPKQRTQGILWGTAGAIVLRIVLIFFALTLLAIPFLKIVGALLLVWIGVKLLVPDHEDGHANIEGSDKLWGAVKTVIIADLVMSVDNVIAIAGAAEASGTGHSMALVIFGVLVSIPIIVWGSQLVHQADGPLPDDHHAGRHAARLDRRHDDGHRSGADQPGRDARHAQDRGDRPGALWRRGGRCPAGAGARQVDIVRAPGHAGSRCRLPQQPAAGRAACAACCWRWTGPRRSTRATQHVHRDAPGPGRPGHAELHLVHVQRPVSRRRLVLRCQQDARGVLPGAERRRAGAVARRLLDQPACATRPHARVGDRRPDHRRPAPNGAAT